jgi:hypothetical protein
MGAGCARGVAVVMAVASVAVACSDATPVAPRAVASPPHVVSGVLDCEVTIDPRTLTGDSGQDRPPSIHCGPLSSQDTMTARAAVRPAASDTILQSFNQIGFAYGTPTWSTIVGTVTVPISIVNHTTLQFGTLDGVHAAPNGTRVFVISGPTVLASGGLGITPAIGLSNPTGMGTFTSANQPYFQYSGIIMPGATSTSVSWVFTFLDVGKFNFQVGVDAIVP